MEVFVEVVEAVIRVEGAAALKVEKVVPVALVMPRVNQIPVRLAINLLLLNTFHCPLSHLYDKRLPRI